MDVNITSGTKAKLTIFEEDDPATIVNAFSKAHSLNDAKKIKLLEVVLA